MYSDQAAPPDTTTSGGNVPQYFDSNPPPSRPRQKAPNAKSPAHAIPRLYDDERYVGMTGLGRLVLRALIDKCDKATSTCKSPLDKIAKDCGCSKRHVQRTVHAMHDSGLIRYEQGISRVNKGVVMLPWATWGLPEEYEDVGVTPCHQSESARRPTSGDSPDPSLFPVQPPLPHPPVIVDPKGRLVMREDLPVGRVIGKICRAQELDEGETSGTFHKWHRYVIDLIGAHNEQRVEDAADMFIERYSNRGDWPDKWPPMLRWFTEHLYKLALEVPSPKSFDQRDGRPAIDKSKIGLQEHVNLFEGGETVEEAIKRLTGN